MSDSTLNNVGWTKRNGTCWDIHDNVPKRSDPSWSSEWPFGISIPKEKRTNKHAWCFLLVMEAQPKKWQRIHNQCTVKVNRGVKKCLSTKPHKRMWWTTSYCNNNHPRLPNKLQRHNYVHKQMNTYTNMKKMLELWPILIERDQDSQRTVCIFVSV